MERECAKSCWNCRHLRVKGFDKSAKQGQEWPFCSHFNQHLGNIYGFDSSPCGNWRIGRTPRKEKKRIMKMCINRGNKKYKKSNDLPF